MQTFRIDDDVQKTIDHHIQNCKGFSFISSFEKLDFQSDEKTKYIWLMTTGTTSVIKNFIKSLIEKYRKLPKYINEKNIVKADHYYVFLKIID
ncbi:MAG: hypothetical protein A2W91_06310 [Bacteroidetes bacterium GWF2_38_335]|nr:MAG: hypothetical protein A2W91_06310 [Bacteroidetes bacterium GWF2_38_335]HBS89155.1 hypothetical protein [Bacteroidales bacterium]